MTNESDNRFISKWAQREIVGGPVGLVDDGIILDLLTRFRIDARTDGQSELAAMSTDDLEPIIRDLVESADGVLE